VNSPSQKKNTADSDCICQLKNTFK
jgi:hypothetical protein